MIPYIHLLVGFILANLVLIRPYTINQSHNSPNKFSIKFFILDNWPKWVVSVPMSIIILYILISSGATAYISNTFNDSDLAKVLNMMFPFLIGFSPDFALGIFKRFFGILQPKTVMGYDRTRTKKAKRKRDNEHPESEVGTNI